MIRRNLRSGRPGCVTLPLTSCGALGKFLNLSVPIYSPVNGANKSSYPVGLSQVLNEATWAK